MCVIDRVHALADADNQNLALDLFDRLGNPIPYGDTPNNENEDYAKDLTGVEECDNKHEIPGVTTPEEEEEIIEMEIPEDADEKKGIAGVNKNT